MVLAGYLFSCGSIFAWGTALIFLKLDWVVQAKLTTQAKVFYYSLGYLVASLCAWLLLNGLSQPAAVTPLGVAGGVIWGLGKLLTILSVTGELGIASGQAVQCAVNVFTSFLAGAALLGESVWWANVLGAVVLAMGLGLLVLPRVRASDASASGSPAFSEENLLGKAAEDSSAAVDPESGRAAPLGARHWVQTKATGVAFAMASGVCMWGHHTKPLARIYCEAQAKVKARIGH